MMLQNDGTGTFFSTILSNNGEHHMDRSDDSSAANNIQNNTTSYFTGIYNSLVESMTQTGHLLSEVNSNDENRMADQQARRLTFNQETWFGSSTTADAMAFSGLYYTGVADITQCFCCKKAQNNWSPNKKICDSSNHEVDCDFFANFNRETNGDARFELHMETTINPVTNEHVKGAFISGLSVLAVPKMLKSVFETCFGKGKPMLPSSSNHDDVLCQVPLRQRGIVQNEPHAIGVFGEGTEAIERQVGEDGQHVEEQARVEREDREQLNGEEEENMEQPDEEISSNGGQVRKGLEEREEPNRQENVVAEDPTHDTDNIQGNLSYQPKAFQDGTIREYQVGFSDDSDEDIYSAPGESGLLYDDTMPKNVGQ